MHLNDNQEQKGACVLLFLSTAVVERRCTTVVIIRQRVSECRSNAAASAAQACGGLVRLSSDVD